MVTLRRESISSNMLNAAYSAAQTETPSANSTRTAAVDPAKTADPVNFSFETEVKTRMVPSRSAKMDRIKVNTAALLMATTLIEHKLHSFRNLVPDCGEEADAPVYRVRHRVRATLIPRRTEKPHTRSRYNRNSLASQASPTGS